MIILKRYLAPILLFALLLLQACGGGGGGGGSAPIVPSVGNSASTDKHDPFSGGFTSIQTTINNESSVTSCDSLVGPPAGSTLTGKVTFQRVPLLGVGLSYGAATSAPARGVVVEAVSVAAGSCSNTVVATTLSDGDGDYGFLLPLTQAVCVRARAQMYRSGLTGGGSWDFQVSDNSRSNSPYYLLDNNPATVADAPIRDFDAGSGWSVANNRYTGTRSAAPFAILDSNCHALANVLTADSGVSLPTLNYRWSKNNNEADGDASDGDVGGAYFSVTNKLSGSTVIDQAIEIFLLGDDGFDTDEYDQHVITHEFGHYLSFAESRSDSFGGSHSLEDKLDMTVAFDEGWGDAFSGIVLKGVDSSQLLSTEVYQDTYGFAQQGAFKFSLENYSDSSSTDVDGWFDESSVFKIIYDLFDPDEGSGFDRLNFNFSQLYSSLVAIKNTKAMVSIYSYIDRLKTDNAGDAAAIDTLIANESLVVNDKYGTSQPLPTGLVANNNDDVTPVYKTATVGANTSVCSNTQFGAFNKLSVARYVKFNAPSSRSYTLSLSPTNNGKPVIEVYKSGSYIGGGERSTPSVLSFTLTMSSGEHVFAIYDGDNILDDAQSNVRKCFTLRVN
ncbi:hypothetical protein [Dasania marina]|uniref:hypothetical protein n=1 Tax=Dasania marina TaxID=471499 RepID=UPI000378E43C|nr:hypothetical protein [Dasania marina]